LLRLRCLGNWNDLRYRTDAQCGLKMEESADQQHAKWTIIRFWFSTNTTQPYPASPTFRSLFESKVGLCQAESNNCVCARTLVLTAAMCQGRALPSRVSDVQFLLASVCSYSAWLKVVRSQFYVHKLTVASFLLSIYLF
ncbi:hypothetical protein KCU92_g375, partial [Aureobasidium melanogenum]